MSKMLMAILLGLGLTTTVIWDTRVQDYQVLAPVLKDYAQVSQNYCEKNNLNCEKIIDLETKSIKEKMNNCLEINCEIAVVQKELNILIWQKNLK
jgi:hypothetical protein